MTIDGAEALSKVSGIPRTEVLSIWEQVKANSAKLRACPRHRFPGGDVKIGQKLTCLACGGEMGIPSIADYVRGYEAAGGSADDIWPGMVIRKPTAP